MNTFFLQLQLFRNWGGFRISLRYFRWSWNHDELLHEEEPDYQMFGWGTMPLWVTSNWIQLLVVWHCGVPLVGIRIVSLFFFWCVYMYIYIYVYSTVCIYGNKTGTNQSKHSWNLRKRGVWAQRANTKLHIVSRNAFTSVSG